MKNFKLKFFSLILCICMCLSFFTGCSLFVKNDNADAEEVVMTVGTREITREELLNSYYSFYQQNSYYFMYYDEETILNTFYDSIVSRYMILSEAERLMEGENGEEPELVFSVEDMKKVWDNVFDYVNGQLDTIEKALLLQKNGNKEDELPERLQTKETSESETAYKYEPYDPAENKLKEYEKGDRAPKVDAEYISDKISELKQTGIYTYYEDDETTDDEDKERTPLYITDENEKAVRLEAFNKYLADLMFSAKANKKDSKQDVVLKAEIERLYKSYYESALYSEYQEYITSGTNEELAKKFADSEIADLYVKLYSASKEANSLEDNYKSVITGSSSSLTLYHYNGRYVYFTVQHILVPFDAETLEILKEIPGYDTAVDARYRDVYEQIRKEYYDKGRSWTEGEGKILSTVERDADGNIVHEKSAEGEELDKEKKVSVATIVNEFNTEYDGLVAAHPEWEEEDKIHAKAILFQQYSFKYSSDTGSLKNDLTGVLGFTISSEPDQHGSYVKDFTNGARKQLFEEYMSGRAKIGEIAEVVSDYGVHIMMLTGVYEAGPVIDLNFGDMTSEEKQTAIVEALKGTRISELTDETYYDYIYDLIKENLVGSSGTYFTDYRNSLMKKFEDDGKVVYKNKLTYKQLNDSINR